MFERLVQAVLGVEVTVNIDIPLVIRYVSAYILVDRREETWTEYQQLQ